MHKRTINAPPRTVTFTSYCHSQPDSLVRLLLIEDEQEATLMIAKGLRQDSHTVDVASEEVPFSSLTYRLPATLERS